MTQPPTSPRSWRKRHRWKDTSLSSFIGSFSSSASSSSPTSPFPSSPLISPPILISPENPLRNIYEQRQLHSHGSTDIPTLRLIDPTAPRKRAVTMNVSLLKPAAATAGRAKQIREAKEMEAAVFERANRMGSAVPPYEFLELIGKGSFGRVFKCRSTNDKSLVAVKVIDVDSSDYKLDAKDRDQAIQDFMNEISILRQLKDSKAKNVNALYDAFAFHSQLWIVSEYCPGGSLHTLMKASPKGKPGLEEKYIIAAARELAVALKAVHDIGIIHRDVKAANVLISQDGRLQLCDFGVSGVLESNVAKRSTIIGTPFWMPPEMLQNLGYENASVMQGYKTEIDCWAFGCTIYELATGLPPNARVAPERLAASLENAPRLEAGEYSDELREFVAFCLEENPKKRPSADDILRHNYLVNTSKRYPTSILKELIEKYARWEQVGGQRQSLFDPHGATGPERLDDLEEDDDWNFSTTDDFNTMMVSQLKAPDVRIDDYDKDQNKAHTMPIGGLSLEKRAQRIGVKMDRIFDENAKSYNAAVDLDTDLPLRDLSDGNNVRESVIDLDGAIDMELETSNIDLTNIPTIRARQSTIDRLDYGYNPDEEEEAEYYDPDKNLTKRKTRDWKFPAAPSMTMPAPVETIRPKTQEWTFPKLGTINSDPEVQVLPEIYQEQQEDTVSPLLQGPVAGNDLAPAFRPALIHTATEPLGNFGGFLGVGQSLPGSPSRSSMIDLDAADAGYMAHSPKNFSMSETFDERSTPYSSFDTSMTTQSNPFSFADEPEIDSYDVNQYTIKNSKESQRASLHMHTQSEPNRLSDNSAEFAKAMQPHNRGSSLGSERPTSLMSQPPDDYGDANLADNEDTQTTDRDEANDSGLEMRHRDSHEVWDEFKTNRHAPHRSLSARDRLKPGSTYFRRSRHSQQQQQVQKGHAESGTARYNGSLRTTRPSWALTAQNVAQQPNSESMYQTQRWIGETSAKDGVYDMDNSRMQNYAEEPATNDDSDTFLSPSRTKRSYRQHAYKDSSTLGRFSQHYRDGSYSTMLSASTTDSRNREKLYDEGRFHQTPTQRHHHDRQDSYDRQSSVSMVKSGSRDDTESSGSRVGGLVSTAHFPDISAPKQSALEENADEETMMYELERLLEDFAGGLRVIRGLIQDVGDGDGISPKDAHEGISSISDSTTLTMMTTNGT